MSLLSSLLTPIAGGSGSANDKGYFADETALEAAFPTGEAGWFAIVGSTDTVWVWDVETTAWKDTGNSASIADYKGHFDTPTDLSTAYPTGEEGWWAYVISTNSMWGWVDKDEIWVDQNQSAGGDVTTAILNAALQSYEGIYVNPTTGDDGNDGAPATPYQTIQAVLNITPRISSKVIYVKGSTTENLTFNAAHTSLIFVFDAKSQHTGNVNLVAGNTSIYFTSAAGQGLTKFTRTINDASAGSLYYQADMTGSTYNKTGGSGSLYPAGFVKFEGSVDGMVLNLTGNTAVQTTGSGAMGRPVQTNGILSLGHEGSALAPDISGGSLSTGFPVFFARQEVQLFIGGSLTKALTCSADYAKVLLFGCSTRQVDLTTYAPIDFTGSSSNVSLEISCNADLAGLAGGDIYPTNTLIQTGRISDALSLLTPIPTQDFVADLRMVMIDPEDENNFKTIAVQELNEALGIGDMLPKSGGTMTGAILGNVGENKLDLVNGGGGLKLESGVSDALISVSNNGTDYADYLFKSDGTLETADTVQLNGQTASTLIALDSDKKITSLDTAAYPSLTEFSYVKGLSSALQTQLDGKQSTIVEDGILDASVVESSLTKLGVQEQNLQMNDFLIKNLGNPTDAKDAVNKSYVDNLAFGLATKSSISYATAAALPANTYNNGTAGVGATLTANANGALIVDGATVAINTRVMIKNEANAIHNGFYLVSDAGSAGTAWVLTRTTDADTSLDLQGAWAVILDGTTTNKGYGYQVQSGVTPIVIGTDDINFGIIIVPTDYIGGTGITISGSEIALDTSIAATLSGNQTLLNKTLINAIVGTQATGNSSTLAASTAFVQAAANAKVVNTLVGGETDKAPSVASVNAGLATKAPAFPASYPGNAFWASPSNGNGAFSKRAITVDDLPFDILGRKITVGTPTSTTSITTAGYLGLPIRTVNSNKTIDYSDIATDQYCNASVTIAIPSQVSSALPVGFFLQITAEGGTVTVTIGGGDALYWADGSVGGKVGTRTISLRGVACIKKVASGKWYLTGVGVS